MIDPDKESAPETGGPDPMPTGCDPDQGPRNILLFSDGTGNSSAKLQKTNVWRLYEALDLGYPVRDGQPVQIAYYDDGVGNSAVRLLAILGGVFGFGLARNVRDIYKYLCRNHRPDDRIYAFGFSRGAFTIRLLVSLVGSMGLVPYDPQSHEGTGRLGSEARLERQTRDMWREYRRGFHTNNAISDLFVTLARAILRLVIRGKRRLLRQEGYAACLPADRHRPWWGKDWWQHWWQTAPRRPEVGEEIAFVGVWDTVAAYGGPLVEITRAVDEWLWPLTMANYRLSDKVVCARHALAIDDKRDAFQPLLWDEVQEADRGGHDPDNPRLQQVWFAGMHADVGGGYADDSLSYVSLWWMIEHAKRAGVRLLPCMEERIETFRNVYGPIHDSRGGGGAFYRYQPRYIKAWIDHEPGEADDCEAPGPEAPRVAPATQLFRDPTIDHGRYTTHGLLVSPIRLHHSVEERLRLATDGYGPNNLPVNYRVDDGVRGTRPPSVSKLPNPACMDSLGDGIKLRRFWYFVSVAIVLLILSKPLWLPGSVDARLDEQLVMELATFVLPGFVEIWVRSMLAHPLVSGILIGGLLASIAIGVGHERVMVDVSRAMWRHRFGGKEAPPPSLHDPVLSRGWRKLARGLRRSDAAQGFLARIKWKTMPRLIGAAMLAVLAIVVASAATQLFLWLSESRTCRPVDGPTQVERVVAPVDLRSSCNDLFFQVEGGTTYLVEMRVPHRVDAGAWWRDRGVAASPAGWEYRDLVSWYGLAERAFYFWGRYFRRVISAPLMAPVLVIHSADGDKQMLDQPIHMIVPKLSHRPRPGREGVWRGKVVVPKGRSGRLMLFVNSAVLPPLGVDALYRNNRGEACVAITRLPRPRGAGDRDGRRAAPDHTLCPPGRPAAAVTPAIGRAAAAE